MTLVVFYQNGEVEALRDCNVEPMKETRRMPLGTWLCRFLDIPMNLDTLGSDESHPYFHLSDVKNSISVPFIVKNGIENFLEAALEAPEIMTLSGFEHYMALYGYELPSWGVRVPENESAGALSLKERLLIPTPEKIEYYTCTEKQGETYGILEQICVASMYQVFNKGLSFKKCGHCGHWFVPSRKDELYCTIRPNAEFPHDCREAAKYEKQLARERSSESAKIYKSINTMKARTLRDSSISARPAAEKDLYDFRDRADQWRQDIKSGKASEADYIAWLNSHKKRR